MINTSVTTIKRKFNALQFTRENHNLRDSQQVKFIDYGNRGDFYNQADSSTATGLFTKKFYCKVEGSSTVSLFHDAALTVPVRPSAAYTGASINLVPVGITAADVVYTQVSSIGISYATPWINNSSNITVGWANQPGLVTWINSIRPFAYYKNNQPASCSWPIWTKILPIWETRLLI